MGLGGIAAGVGAAASVASAANSIASDGTAGAQAAGGDFNGAALATGALNNITGALTPYTTLGATALGGLTGALSSDQTGTNYVGQANALSTDAGTELGTAQGYNQDAANIYGTLQNGISQQTLENTPGYQFTLNQGLESTQNSAAARGLANSGAALKGAATYATGLANDTYQNQYNDLLSTASGYSGLANNATGVASGYNTAAGTTLNQQASLLDTNNQNYNQLLQASTLGENAANQYGEYATNAAQTAAGLAANAGQAQASGTVGQASALNSGLSGVSSSLSQGLLLNKLLGSSSSTTPAVTGTVGSLATSGPFGDGT